MLLGKESILAAQDLKIESVDVPEWGGSVNVRVMTGSERDSFEQSIIKTDGDKVTRSMENMRAKLLVRTICDDKGKRIFTDKDVDLLGGKAASAIEKVFELAQKMNKLGGKDLEELEKNSEGGEKDISTLASPGN